MSFFSPDPRDGVLVTVLGEVDRTRAYGMIVANYLILLDNTVRSQQKSLQTCHDHGAQFSVFKFLVPIPQCSACNFDLEVML